MNATEALNKLKEIIEQLNSEGEAAKHHAAKNDHWQAVTTIANRIQAREDILFIIDELLEKISKE